MRGGTIRIGWVALALGALAACNQQVGGPPVYGSPGPVASRGEMRAFCEDEGARRYNVGRRAVEVGPVEPTSRGYRAEGRVFLGGQRDRFFECRFGPRGGFDGLREIAAGGGGIGGGSDVSRREMRGFCEDEAARRYGVARRDVEIGQVRSTGRGFVTEGRVLGGPRRGAIFECAFGARGGFESMREVSSGGGGAVPQPGASNREMRAVCEAEAARRYGVSRQGVRVGEVRPAGRGFVTEGRITRGPSDGARFECSFGPRGGFDGMRETAAAPVEPASRPEMRRTCRQEAARRYNRPTAQVEVAPVQLVGSNFVAKGQTVQGGRTVIFECAFSARGELGAFRQLSP